MVRESGLEQFPEHVHAIGMISIESANLELALADLLGAALNISRRVAHAIYFTPRAAALRLEILQAAAKARLAPRSNVRSDSLLETQKRDAIRKIERIVKRSYQHIQKRHNIIHDAWTIATYTDENLKQKEVVIQHKVTDALTLMQFQVAKIEDLQKVIHDFRDLIADVRSLTSRLRARPPIMVNLRNPSINSGDSAGKVIDVKVESGKK